MIKTMNLNIDKMGYPVTICLNREKRAARLRPLRLSRITSIQRLEVMEY